MPQIIGAIIAIWIAAWVIAGIIWAVQWIWVGVTWGWQVFFMPFFVYLTPAIFVLLATAAIYWGSWIASRNYIFSLKSNVESEDLTAKLTRNYIISILTFFQIAIYLFFAIASAVLIYEPGQIFVLQVIDHYESIRFPAFRIHFPFWDK